MSESSFNEFGQNSGLVSELFELYKKDASLVEKRWADFFKNYVPKANGAISPQALPNLNGKFAASSTSATTGDLTTQAKVDKLIYSFRETGHRKAKVNPLSQGIIKPEIRSELVVENYAFNPQDLTRSYNCQNLAGNQALSLKEIIATLERIYCGSIGYEISHISSEQEQNWLLQKIESAQLNPSAEQKKQRLKRLIETEEFENQLFKKYIGQKWFSIRGGETLIPFLDALLERGAALGVENVVSGMAHRGRLAVLSFIIGKPLEKIFEEFDDLALYSVIGSGDTKYHKGYSNTYNTTSGKQLQIKLLPNPSHLEAVNPVVEGLTRAVQDFDYARERGKVLPLLMHGDAAFCGQGVVPETLNFSGVAGYSTGGTVHVVINNQVGFTTTGEEGRSSCYCTDIAKSVEIPILHVNSEDLDASCWAAELAAEYRQKFGKDVLIDLICYRRFGHNEADDPSFTQPQMYAEITARKTIATYYSEKLQQEGIVKEEEANKLRSTYAQYWNEKHTSRKQKRGAPASAIHGRLTVPVEKTAVDKKVLLEVAEALSTSPQGFEFHAKLKQLIEKRISVVKEGQGIDWGTAEALAFGSLVKEGVSVRLSGQDSGRGTFTQRHLQYSDYSKPGKYLPLNKLATSGAYFEVYNSTLSEYAVLGFETGYSSQAKKALVLWEAQFGDFANGAQIIIDQFIAASEAKWDLLSGVVLLLPHGYEGMGAEHSSARLERFLQLCAENNMTVAYPSTAAQYFHLLRRQALSEIKRPLIVMTPKSLLRLPEAAANLEQLSSAAFNKIMVETKGKGTHLVCCTGKVYHDLNTALKDQPKANLTLVRVEQLYPFPEPEFKKLIATHKFSTVTWMQEEPANMGAYNFIEPYFRSLGLKVNYVGRPALASPATGSLNRHLDEQKQILDQVLKSIS